MVPPPTNTVILYNYSKRKDFIVDSFSYKVYSLVPHSFDAMYIIIINNNIFKQIAYKG